MGVGKSRAKSSSSRKANVSKGNSCRSTFGGRIEMRFKNGAVSELLRLAITSSHLGNSVAVMLEQSPDELLREVLGLLTIDTVNLRRRRIDDGTVYDAVPRRCVVVRSGPVYGPHD